MRAARAPLEVEVTPPWPYRLPRYGGGDGLMRVRGGVVRRLLTQGGPPVLVRAWQRREGRVALRAESADATPVTPERLAWAIDRVRFVLGVDEDLKPFYERFRADPLLGPAIRARPWLRPRRNASAWEALCWAITGQLIEASRASEIQRTMVRRWGPRAAAMRDAPPPERIAALAPFELCSAGLAEKRALAMRRCAAEVASGRLRLDGSGAERRRLLAIPEVGPWTVQCTGLFGLGQSDELPAGDLAYVKLVGRLAGLGRRAEVEEVEAFFAPYEPFRGLAGIFILLDRHRALAPGAGVRMAA